MIIKDHKLVIKTEQNAINFDLHETDLSIKQNDFLTENTMKNELVDYCPNMIMETIIMNIETWKTLKLDYNGFHNIFRLFDVLPSFPFTTTETKLDY